MPEVYYVNRDGSHGAATHLPSGALAIGEAQYELVRDNPGLIDIVVEGSVVHIRPSLISYKKTAAAAIRREIHQHIPDESRLNHLARAVLCDQGCFDVTSGLMLTSIETSANLSVLNRRHNELLHMQARYISKVDSADNVITVDDILGQFERTLQGIV